MSMQPRPWPEVPADTARVAKRAFRKGALASRARDQLGSWLADAQFAAAYGVRGGLRERLVAGRLERTILDLLLARLGELGLVAAGGRQRTDSTHVLAAIRGLHRLELAGETVRAALEALAAAAPDWLSTVVDASWQEVYGQRVSNFRLPASQAKRAELAVRYGRDGYHVFDRICAAGAPGWLAGLPAVQALRQVWVQQYYRGTGAGGEKVIWRQAAQQARAGQTTDEPDKPQTNGNAATTSGPALRGPSPRPPTSPPSAAPATFSGSTLPAPDRKISQQGLIILNG